MKSARTLVSEGLTQNDHWRLGAGITLGLFGFLRRTRHRQPELVRTLRLAPGDSVTVTTRTPPPTRKQLRKAARRRR
ncbi:MAG: hypothetical protein U0U69_14660 [Acidimicrobiia bacterium]